MKSTKKALIIGAGVSGLITAKELVDVGISDITIVEKNETLGGVWHQYCWHNTTLTSSKWITEFGCYPMPDEYLDYLTPQQMMEYLYSFTKEFDLEKFIKYGEEVKEININNEEKYEVITNKKTYINYDFIVICSGLNGSPKVPDLEGLKMFQGSVIHGSEYKTPDIFRDKRVLCIGLGESGIGISSDICSVAKKTFVSATSFTPAPRVQPYTNLPFDQMQFWPIGKYMKDYQDVLTWGGSWYNHLPKPLNLAYAKVHPALRLFPQQWLPKAFIPYNWHGKYWPKPSLTVGDISGNLTLPENPSDDILYLVHSKQIIPKNRVVKFDENHAYFEDGSQEEIDAIVFNIGYNATVMSMELPNNWQYEHQKLYKGCFTPQLPNFAIVGLVRPTIGSIVAMAEMQARLVAQVFAGKIELPLSPQLELLIEKEAKNHQKKCPVLQKKSPHIYFFDQWMEEMADLIGVAPKWWLHLNSFKELVAYWFGAPMPLRFRLRGVGAVENGYEKYAQRVDRIYGKRPGSDLKWFLIFMLIYPHLLTILIGLSLFFIFHLSLSITIGIALIFWLSYMKINLFRFIFSIPFLLLRKKPLEMVLVEYNPNLDSQTFKSVFGIDFPNYKPLEKSH